MKKTRAYLQTGAVLSCVLFSSSFSSATLASGFRLPELSTAGTAMSNAMVANPDTPGALPYNPAATGFQTQGELVVGAIFIQPDISVTPDGGTSVASQGKETVAVPNVFASNLIDNNWSWGVGINAPFGLETRWQAGTFDTFATLGVAFLEPEHSKIEMLNVNPNVAYRFGNTSIALGIDNYQVRKLIFNTQSIRISGSGQDYGWNIGLLHAQNNWSVGLSYRSNVKVKVNGTVDGTLIGSSVSNADAEIDFPSLLQVGARYQFNDRLAMELDVERTGWSSFDTIEVNHSSSPPLSSPIISRNDWKDATAYRLGGSYELSSTDQLRFGYSFDGTPGNDDFFSARVPGNDRQTFSLGLAHEQAGWTVEFAYMYVQAEDREINAPANSYLTRLGSGDTDPNGTDAFNGTYKLSAHLVAFGVNTHF
ncbi:MAG TPA: aromatic hydrocarbon degradation protein [Gammaproteobacteria bacterium]|nr:aromatic hydrocarbon degradation protein [Gammaproteobacteria bacterium]